MLPPLALEAAHAARGTSLRGRAVLDLCASPGGKSGILGRIVGAEGFVLANEPNKDRYATLKQNLFRTHCLNVGVCSYAGERLPMENGGWDAILLDPPCSGWGTVDKNPSVKRIWRGEKIDPLAALQRKLLAEAARLLAAGGLLLYSTCTTNVQENEDQIRWAEDLLDLERVPLAPFPGFVFSQPEIQGCLRVEGELSQAQGFFLACLAKPGAKALSQDRVQDLHRPGHAAALDPETLATHDASMDWNALRHGECYVFNDALTYLPRRGLECVASPLHWQGYVLGKWTTQAFRPHSRVRLLMPLLDAARCVETPQRTPSGERPSLEVRSDRAAISTTDVGLIEALLAGQSLRLTSNPGLDRVGLYFDALPLCWLRVKGSRLLWSER